MQIISPETIFRGNNAWQKSLPHITKLTKSPLILGRGINTNNLRIKIFNDLKDHNLEGQNLEDLRRLASFLLHNILVTGQELHQ